PSWIPRARESRPRPPANDARCYGNDFRDSTRRSTSAARCPMGAYRPARRPLPRPDGGRPLLPAAGRALRSASGPPGRRAALPLSPRRRVGALPLCVAGGAAYGHDAQGADRWEMGGPQGPLGRPWARARSLGSAQGPERRLGALARPQPCRLHPSAPAAPAPRDPALDRALGERRHLRRAGLPRLLPAPVRRLDPEPMARSPPPGPALR